MLGEGDAGRGSGGSAAGAAGNSSGRRWWLGLVPLAVLWAASNWLVQDRIEAELAARSERALAPAGRAEAATAWARVEPSGRDLRLTGTAPSTTTKQAVLARLRSVPGVRRIEDAATAFADQHPFTWTATREAGRLVLAGAVPAAEREAVLDKARQAFPAIATADEAVSAGGAPDAFAAAAALALDQLARLEAGTVTVIDRTVALRGRAASLDAYEAVRAAARQAPEGFSLDLSGLEPALVQPFVWSAAQTGEEVALAGFAPSEAAREEVVAAARRAFPTRPVVDRMRVAGGLPPGVDFAALARFSLRQLPRLRSGTVTLSDEVLAVRGEAADKDALAALGTEFRQGLPAGLRAGEVALEAAVVSPYAFEARRGAAILRLGGYLPDDNARESVRKLVARRFFQERILDETRLADGAPRNYLSGVAFALEQLSLLSSGEARVSDASIRIAGETLYPQVAEAMRARMPASAPSGWTALADVRARAAEGLIDPQTCQELASRLLERSPVRFGAGEGTLAPESQAVLDELADVAKRCFPARIEIAGRADSAGSPNANLTLSRSRARAVADYLVKAGVPADRIEAVGYGENHPPAASKDEGAGKRRIAFVVKP